MTIEKIKVDKLSIVVTGSKEKPYFQITYHEIGKGYDNLGFGSYYLDCVFSWKEEYFEIVKASVFQKVQAGIISMLRKVHIFIE